MATERFSTEIKTRISPRQKRQLARIAADRQLAVSDVVREAFRMLAERHSATRDKEKVAA